VTSDASHPWIVRSYLPTDLPACRTLYVEGLIGGRIAENDTGLDIDDIDHAYMVPGNHFWVVENASGEIVAMLGVQHVEQGVAEIRRLRVRLDHRRRGIGQALIETALKFCNDNGYLKITLDTFMERDAALRLFDKFRFRHARTRRVNDRDLMYFYLDLYSSHSTRAGAPSTPTPQAPPSA
jgi:ribosomal protein S18 acetylase RimI-like enzyme